MYPNFHLHAKQALASNRKQSGKKTAKNNQINSKNEMKTEKLNQNVLLLKTNFNYSWKVKTI